MTKEDKQKKHVENMQDLVSKIHNSYSKKEKSNQASAVSKENTEAYSNMRVRALKYIGIDRGRSFAQVERILIKSFPEIAHQNPDLIRLVIEDLIRDDYLDEYLCGRRLIKRHSARKQKSKYYIKQLMLKQGISKSVVNDLVSEIEADEITAEIYFRERLKEWDFNKPEKIVRHFASRGYSAGVILKIMRKYRNE